MKALAVGLGPSVSAEEQQESGLCLWGGGDTDADARCSGQVRGKDGALGVVTVSAGAQCRRPPGRGS